MLNYYRALVQRRYVLLGRIKPKTQILWGVEDGALLFDLAVASLDLCDDGRLKRFAGTHWLQLDQREAVAKALIAF